MQRRESLLFSSPHTNLAIDFSGWSERFVVFKVKTTSVTRSRWVERSYNVLCIPCCPHPALTSMKAKQTVINVSVCSNNCSGGQCFVRIYWFFGILWSLKGNRLDFFWGTPTVKSEVTWSRKKNHSQVLELIKDLVCFLLFKLLIYIYVFCLSYRFHSESLEEKLESLDAEDLMSHLSRPETYLEEEKRSSR